MLDSLDNDNYTRIVEQVFAWHDELQFNLRSVAKFETRVLKSASTMGIPDRWWTSGVVRCIREHVSSRVIINEGFGYDACPVDGCRAPTFVTFPEDKTGPLDPPHDMLLSNGFHQRGQRC